MKLPYKKIFYTNISLTEAKLIQTFSHIAPSLPIFFPERKPEKFSMANLGLASFPAPQEWLCRKSFLIPILPMITFTHSLPAICWLLEACVKAGLSLSIRQFFPFCAKVSRRLSGKITREELDYVFSYYRFSHYSAISKFSGQNTNGRSSISRNKQKTSGVRP